MADSTAASASTSLACQTCKKTEEELGAKLQRCGRCDTFYCSRSCQTLDWKKHKKSCAKNRQPSPNANANANADAGSSSPPSSSSPSPGPRLAKSIKKPFSRLEAGTFLHGLPEQDTYQLLIDTYRLRMDDICNLEGVREPDSVYASAANDGTSGFHRFLGKVKAKPDLLPGWWNDDKQRECEALGARPGWCKLANKRSKADIMDHYGDSQFPMKIRMLGEAVYGNDKAYKAAYPNTAANKAADIKNAAEQSRMQIKNAAEQSRMQQRNVITGSKSIS
ncbi:putative MYND domain protein [Xylariaceae sp. FL0804]|nr:putative MYND domain protein [Xylariaceae sp. FL0804]